MSPALWIDGALALVVVTYYARHFAFRLYDPDLGGRLAVGRLFSQLGRMPITDPFSYTATLPVWVDHEWLTGVAFHGANCIGGDAAVIVLKTVLGLGMLGFVWATARLNGARTLPLMVLLAIAMPVFGYGLMPRAQVFTYLLFAQWLYLLERARHGGSAWLLMLLPITMPLWANLHGGFLAGLGLLALYALGSIADKPRCARLTLLFVLCVSVTLINPYGLDYWRYLLTAVTMQRPGVHEWAPPPWTASYAQFWFLALSTTIAIVYCLRNRKLRLAPLLVMAVTLILAMCSARHMPLFAIATISFLPRIWSKIIATGASQATWPVRARLLDYLLIACLLAAAAFQGYGMFVLDGPARFDVPGRSTSIENMVVYPVEAIDFAEQQHLQGNLAVPFNWGEYAIWRMYPRCQVSLDGRYETAYPPETVTLVESFFSATSDWRRLLDECPTDHVLAPADSRVNQELAKLPEWHRIHSDPTAVLWSRRSARQASRP